jgi:hypothetical protein
VSLFDFLQWCFRSDDTSALTIIVGWLLFAGLAKVVRALRRGEEE